jgi:hypothetical protein
MQGRQVAKILIGRGAARFVSDRRPLTSREKWLLGKGTDAGEGEEEDEAKVMHGEERIASPR